MRAFASQKGPEARSSRELGDFFDALGPTAYAQEAPLPDDESDDETKTPS